MSAPRTHDEPLAATEHSGASTPHAGRSQGALRRARARLRRWLRPPRILRPTRAGWIFFGITFSTGFAALNTGNNLLYLVLSLMLAFLVLSGVLSESALRGIAVRRRLPAEAFARSDASVAIEIVNHQKRVPSLAIAVEDCFAHDDDRPPEKADTAGGVFALRVAAQAVEHRRYVLRPERRGPLRLSGVRVTTRFPFGLFSKSKWLTLPGELLVYPALEPRAAAVARVRPTEPGDGNAARVREGAEVTGLREFRTGDSYRRVHWKASLRSTGSNEGSDWLVREPEDSQQREAHLHLATAGATPGEEFEAAVVRVATQVVAQLDAGVRVALTTSSARIEPDCGARHRARLLAFLARVAPDPAPAAELDRPVDGPLRATS